MEQKAVDLNKTGLDLVIKGKLQEAVKYFTEAIECDPYFPDPYHNRGEALLLLNRLVEANTDLRKAKDLRSGKVRRKTEKAPRMDTAQIDSVYDSVFPEDAVEQDDPHLSFDNSIYDTVFSDDSLDTDDTWGSSAPPAAGGDTFAAILEFVGGKQVEVPALQLFTPTMGDVSLIRNDGIAERVISLEQLGCIRIAGLPPELAREQDCRCHVEIIETITGNIFYEAIHPDQDLENVLIGFSTKENTRFIYTLIPSINIKKRSQQRFLGDILLEKRFIADSMLKKALDEHRQAKDIKLGKILAQKTHVLYSAIEEELEKARKANIQGLKTGEILLASGLVNEEQVLEALEYQEHLKNMKIGQFLIEKGVIQEKDLYLSLAEKFRIPFLDLRKQKVSRSTLESLPPKMILDYEILPVSRENGTLTIATLHPDTSSLCEMILKQVECDEVHFVLAQPTHLRNIIRLLFKKLQFGS